jgi:replicative DNA helicase
VNSTYTASVAAAEAGIVGTCLLYPDLADTVDLLPEQILAPQWRIAWQAIRALRSDNASVDPVTVAAAAERAGRPLSPEDLSTALCDHAASEPLLAEYVALVRDAWVGRQVELAVSEVTEARQRGMTGAEALSLAFTALSRIEAEQPSRGMSIGDLVRQRFKQLGEMVDARDRGEYAVSGIPTGIRQLDDLLGGLQRGIVTIGAGRPGMGKSALGLAIANNVSAGGGGVHVFSLEDLASAYTDRGLAAEAGVPAESFRTQQFTRGDLQRITHSVGRLRNREGWFIDDRAGITPDEIVRSVRRERKRNKTQLVVVDFIQRLKRQPRQERRDMIDEAMIMFADAAKADGMAYLVIAQINRDCEKRDDKRPILSDLKESGGLEEYAKCVMFVYRPHYYDQNAPSDLIELIIRKNNNGRTGTVEANWDGPTVRIW